MSVCRFGSGNFNFEILDTFFHRLDDGRRLYTCVEIAEERFGRTQAGGGIFTCSETRLWWCPRNRMFPASRRRIQLLSSLQDVCMGCCVFANNGGSGTSCAIDATSVGLRADPCRPDCWK